MLTSSALISDKWRVVALLVCLPIICISASAQQKVPSTRDSTVAQTGTVSSPSAEADLTTAAFGDWVLKCVKLPDDAKPARTCEVIHQVVVEGQPGPILQLAIGSQKADQRQLVIVLPPNVLLTRPPEIVVPKEAAPLATVWRRCVPGACFADVGFSEKMSQQDQGGVVRFTDASNRPVEVPFSTRGLKQALDALSRS